MKELGELLIDVHSQHQNLLLNKEGFQLNVLDILSHNEEALSAYQHIFGAWKQAQQDLEALVARATISVSNWNSWKRHTCLPVSRRSWSKRQIR